MVTELPRIQSLSVLCVADIHNEQSTKASDGELGCLCGKAGTSHLCDMAPPIHLGAWSMALIITLMHPYCIYYLAITGY